ncbi:MAG: VWA domain-containing protein [bacterium]|nr:VWA domain-containing protein [bacterium]
MRDKHRADVRQAAVTVSLRDLCKLAGLSEEGEQDGFALASEYHALTQKFGGRADLRAALDREVVEAIIRRARQIIQSAATLKRLVIEPYTEPGRGELLLEESLDEWVAQPHPTSHNLKVGLRLERELDIALMLDTSLSMIGRKLALSAVTAAVLACRSRSQRYSITLFQSGATTIKRLGDPLPLRPMVNRIFEEARFGYTNLEAALTTAARDLARGSRRSRSVGVIITDGSVTQGGNPLSLAARFDALHVIMIEDLNMDRDLCRALADAGHGRLFALQSFEALPRLFAQVLRVIIR